MSQSCDKSIRIFKGGKNKKTVNYNCKHHVKKKALPIKKQTNNQKTVIPDVNEKEKTYKLYLDEEVVDTFFRRPDFSPDGSFFITPAGRIDTADKQTIKASLIYKRENMSSPSLAIPSSKRPSIIIRFCPTLFKRKQSTQQALFDLPYYMVYAIATRDQVIIYNTLSLKPLYMVGKIHFGAHSDLTWFQEK